MNNQEIILQSVSLSKTFADGKLCVEVLKDFNLELRRGEMVAIVGPSGAGKSTLLHLLGGLDEPTCGYVNVAGQNITLLNERHKGRLRNRYIGFVYQFHHLLPEFTALENVAMPLLIGNLSCRDAREKAESILARVGLKDRMEHRIGELSGGERQRVAIARALVNNPACVLADEPTGNLDQHTAGKIFDLLLELNQELKIAFIVVTHDISLAHKMHRIVSLS